MSENWKKKVKWYCPACEKFVDSFVHSQGHMNSAEEWGSLVDVEALLKAKDEHISHMSLEWTRNTVNLEKQLEAKTQELEKLHKIIVEKVALLNRMIRQHPKSPMITTWITIKEVIEKEFLGEEITFEM